MHTLISIIVLIVLPIFLAAIAFMLYQNWAVYRVLTDKRLKSRSAWIMALVSFLAFTLITTVLGGILHINTIKIVALGWALIISTSYAVGDRAIKTAFRYDFARKRHAVQERMVRALSPAVWPWLVAVYLAVPLLNIVVWNKFLEITVYSSVSPIASILLNPSGFIPVSISELLYLMFFLNQALIFTYLTLVVLPFVGFLFLTPLMIASLLSASRWTVYSTLRQNMRWHSLLIVSYTVFNVIGYVLFAFVDAPQEVISLVQMMLFVPVVFATYKLSKTLIAMHKVHVPEQRI